MKIKNILLAVINVISFAAHAESICSETQMEDLVNAGTPAFADNFFTGQMQSNQVVVVGEIHFYTNLKPRLDLIREYKKHTGPGACVAFELAVRPVGTEISLTTLKSGVDSLKSNEEFKKTPGSDKIIASFQQIYDYYFPMADLTVQLGMKPRSVDHKDHFDFDKSQTVDQRNQAMAENISSLIRNGECSSVLFFVGKAHLSKNTDSSTRVQDLLRSSGLSTITANLQMTNETLPVEARSWSICPFSAKIKLSDYAVISNSGIKSDPYLFPYMMGDQTKWKDFEFSLLAP